MENQNKLTTGQKVIVSVGITVLLIIFICIFFRADIKFFLTSKTIERKYGKIAENSYYIEDNFEYVENYTKAEVNSKQDIINSVYHLINSGSTYAEKYCGKNYTECYNDMEIISNNTDGLSILNNYVHPFNSFESITFNFDNNIIEIEIEHTYSNSEKEEINNIVDKILKETINNNMSTKEKIKTIHDYIINETNYDTLKTKNIKDATYKSNTAYGVLKEHHGICSGYSDAMAIFLNKLNIINYKVSNDQHIWNVVYLNGKWLHLDLTWDDPVSDKNITRDNYFLIPTNILIKLDDNVHYYTSTYFPETVKN
ncbi:MAG: transglutaminase domain-containing protein [Bacilli bacterium]|nr:transglutaminase domain-containing protein [Bacilli bacterium]